MDPQSAARAKRPSPRLCLCRMIDIDVADVTKNFAGMKEVMWRFLKRNTYAKTLECRLRRNHDPQLAPSALFHARHPLSVRNIARSDGRRSRLGRRGRRRRGEVLRGRGGAYLRSGLAQSLRQIERDRFINPQFAGIAFGLDGAAQEFRQISKQQHVAELAAAAHLIDGGQKLSDLAGQLFSLQSLPPSFVFTPGLNVG